MRYLAYTWFEKTKTQEQVLQMSVHEVFVEMRMFAQHNKVETDKWEREKKKMELESKRKSL